MPRRIFPLLASVWLIAAPSDEVGAAEERFLLTAGGLGPIRLDRPADLAALKAAYPEFDFHLETVEREGIPEKQIVAMEHGVQALQLRLMEDRFYDILAVSPRIVGPFGGRVGAPFRDLAVAGCFRGAEGSPYIHCGAARTRRMQYLFVIDGPEPQPDDPVAALRVY